MLSTAGTKNQDNRENWIEETLNKIPPGSRILDAGAGQLRYKHLCSHLDYVSQDFVKYDGIGDRSGLHPEEWNQSGLIDIVSNITSIPEPNASFDAILCVEVLEHLPEPINAIQEFIRLLRPNGHLIITAPFCSLTHLAPFHYYSGFTKYFYEKILVECGFEIIELQANGNYFEYLAQEVRRITKFAKMYTGGKTAHQNEYSSILRHDVYPPTALERFISLLERIKGRDNKSHELLARERVLSILEYFSNNDAGSHELLHFGYHVYARKRKNL